MESLFPPPAAAATAAIRFASVTFLSLRAPAPCVRRLPTTSTNRASPRDFDTEDAPTCACLCPKLGSGNPRELAIRSLSLSPANLYTGETCRRVSSVSLPHSLSICRVQLIISVRVI